MSVTRRHAQGFGAGKAEVQAVVFLAVFLGVAGSELTVNAVVGAVAVAAFLTFPVRPEGQIRGERSAVAHAAAITARHAKAVSKSKSFLTLTALLTGQRARLLGVVEVVTGQRAGAGALVKMAVRWTGKS